MIETYEFMMSCTAFDPQRSSASDVFKDNKPAIARANSNLNNNCYS